MCHYACASGDLTDQQFQYLLSCDVGQISVEWARLISLEKVAADHFPLGKPSATGKGEKIKGQRPNIKIACKTHLGLSAGCFDHVMDDTAGVTGIFHPPVPGADPSLPHLTFGGFARFAMEDDRAGKAKGQPATAEDYEQLQMCSDSCSQKFKLVKKLCTTLLGKGEGVDEVTQSVVGKAKEKLVQFEKEIAGIDTLLWKTAEETTAKEVLDALKTAACSLEAIIKLENQLKGLVRSSKT